MKTITRAQLEKYNACQWARDAFQELFGAEAEVTLDNVNKFLVKFNSGWADWACSELLHGHPKQKEYYNLARGLDNGHKGAASECPACLTLAQEFVRIYNNEEETTNV